MSSRIVFAIFSVALFSGCSTAGPFVTNISSDGKGGIIIEKQKVNYNGFVGTVSNEGGNTTTIQLIDEETMKKIQSL